MANIPGTYPARRPSVNQLQVVLIVFLGSIVYGRAQTPRGGPLDYAGVVFFGAIWKHTPKLTIRTGRMLTGLELDARMQMTGRKDWHAWQRYPAFGLALANFHLGDEAHGNAWGLLPNLQVPVLRTSRWLGVFRVGTGLGYVTHPYDYFTNPGQNAVGSHLNNFTQFRLAMEYRFSAHWRLQAGGALNHFSNGSVALPNYGINLPGGFATLAWSAAGIREAEFKPATASKRGGRYWGGQISGGLALVEYSVFDGPRYPVWTAAGAIFYHLNRVNRFSLGLEYEFNRAVYAWGLRSGGFRSEGAASRGATRIALALADEFLFGAIGIQTLAGLYCGGAANRFTANSWYGKFTTRYYFPPLFRGAFRMHAGITLKAHRTTAEYISLHTGLTFPVKKP